MIKNKYYRAFIVNDNKLETMIIDGYYKREARDKIASFYFSSNKIVDISKFYIFLIRVERVNGDYVDME